MNQSGTKLVLVLIFAAVVLGGVSWWYRYEAAHRASQFWGSEASRLIAESEGFDAIVFQPCTEEELAGLGLDSIGRTIALHDARGQAHLRHAFLSDRNYLWDDPHDPESTRWRLCLRFSEGGSATHILLSDGFDSIAKYDPESRTVTGFSCVPMTLSLTQYFGPLDAQADASTPKE
ncbi:MAG: hypothetical protein AAGD11_18225 [Planctomycetota bacterium]